MQSVCSDYAWAAAFADAQGRGLIDAKDAERANLYRALSLPPPGGWQSETARCLAAGSAAEHALDAIAPAFAPGDVIELRALDPAGGAARSLCGRLTAPDERAKLLGFVREHIGLRNLYIGCNPRRAELAGTDRAGKAEDVTARRVVVLDLDFKDAPGTDPRWDVTVEALQDLNPVLTVNSGNGVQIWFWIADVEGADLPATAKPLADAMARLGADNTSDLPRVMRLPFTPNLPTAAKLKRGAVVKLAAPAFDGGHLVSSTSRSDSPTLETFGAALRCVADRLRLSGRGVAGALPAPSRGGLDGTQKTPTPAPSAELLRMAVDALPNDGPFDNRAEWVMLAHAIKGAAVAGGCEAVGRAVWFGLCGRWRLGGDPAEAERVWDSIHDPHVGWGYLLRTLERVNPAAYRRIKAAEAKLRFAQEAAENVQVLSGTKIGPVAPFSPAQIPPRQWLYGRSAIRKFISVLVSPGGSGKSALMMAEAVAMATGRELLPGEKPIQPLRVWVHNSEDPLDEQLRRLAAAMSHHGITHADLGDRLILTSGRGLPLRLAHMGRDGPEIVPGVVDWVVNTARARDIDVIVLDPLGALHSLPENSNEAMNLLAGAFREIAERSDAAIVLLHHTSKVAASDMDAAGAGASRGASALVDAARVVRQLVRMTAAEAARLGVPEDARRNFLRVENGKNNLSPAADARWLRMLPVSLNNGDATYPRGDEVAVFERWTPPTAVSGTAYELARVQAAIASVPTPPRVDPRSPDWIGWLVARALGLDAGEGVRPQDRDAVQAGNHVRVRAMVDGWLRDGGLTRYEARDPNSRRQAQFIREGTPAAVSALRQGGE